MTTLSPYSRIAVLGGGAWGTALALASIAAGRDTILWAREDDVVAGDPESLLQLVVVPVACQLVKAVGDSADLPFSEAAGMSLDD